MISLMIISHLVGCSLIDLGTSPTAVCIQDQDCSSSQKCVEGQCISQQAELCDGQDNDLDDLIDEGVQNSCGLCGDESLCMPDLSTVDYSMQDCIDDASPCCENRDNLPSTQEEICDEIDNDCDGKVDEDFQDLLALECTVGVGICRQTGRQVCITESNQELLDGMIGNVGCLPDSGALIEIGDEASNEGCDGLDNDCDGQVDEAFISEIVACGEQSCSITATTTCIEGVANDACREGIARTIDNTCDGFDDDCNGRVDEDYISTMSICGLGICSRVAENFCSNGIEQTLCAALAPPLNVIDNDCNGLDDDCDGNLDEAFVDLEITCGVGACQSTGTLSCGIEGVTHSCQPLASNETLDECNGIDDDCDGVIDEDFYVSTITCGTGVCTQIGVQSCGVLDGEIQVINSCVPLDSSLLDDDCNGLDDDCDGNIDEGYVPTATICGLGACQNSGSLVCVAGETISSCIPNQANATEVDNRCNGVDDDCDGVIDEDYVSEPLNCVINACVPTGITLCSNGVETDSCRVGFEAAQDHTCDGFDDDCDGRVDEDYPTRSTTCGLGICQSVGIETCVAGLVQNTCVPFVSNGGDQSCDGVDNDCDGHVDEGYREQVIICGVGACQSVGRRVCQDAQENETCEIIETSNNDENCNGLDDDCDGNIDEGYVSTVTQCGIGACSNTGITFCLDGGVLYDSCSPIVNEIYQDSTCDGVDDDCDGNIDENYTGHIVSCGVGICRHLVFSTCQEGIENEECTAYESNNLDDNCNQLDDDCDGNIDEAFISTEVDCLSCGQTGTTLCTSTGVIETCTYEDMTVDDNDCDGVDDDCDGQVDEDFIALLEDPVICGLGVCSTMATQLVCDQGTVRLDCEMNQNLITADDNCDGLDNDCDGNIDEAFSATIECGVGVCKTIVTQTCVDQEIGPECIAGEVQPETCGDLLDNDCDGNVDEGFDGLGTACIIGTGVCERSGVLICDRHRLVCNAVIGQAEEWERCDGLDNDCDGVLDENVLEEGELCIDDTSSSVCSYGIQVCENNILVCNEVEALCDVSR